MPTTGSAERVRPGAAGVPGRPGFGLLGGRSEGRVEASTVDLAACPGAIELAVDSPDSPDSSSREATGTPGHRAECIHFCKQRPLNRTTRDTTKLL
jgi:hypothetical protein